MAVISKIRDYEIKDANARKNINSLNNNLNNLTKSDETNTTKIIQLNKEQMDLYRKKYYCSYKGIELPEALSDNFFKNFNVLYDGKNNYLVQYNREKYKNVGGTTYYISPNGNNSNDGLTKDTPWLSISYFITHCNAGDTCILLNGMYSKNNVGLNDTYPINKSCNIIGESKDGVWLKASDDYEYTQNGTYPNVYQVARTGCSEVANIELKDKGIINNLTKVNSIEEVSNNINSWFTDGTNVYIQLYDGVIPTNENIALTLSIGTSNIFCKNFFEESKVYIENINILNGDLGNIVCINNNDVDVYLTVYNCKLYNNKASGYKYDGVSNIGCYSICENVIVNNSQKDGFNYHKGTYKEARGIEINCSSVNCGSNQTETNRLSNNSSTAHEASQTLRVNGVYGNCNGGVVVDIGDSVSVLYNCTIFDSYQREYDVLAQNNAIMYMYNCSLKGSLGVKNLTTSGENAHIYHKDTTFDTFKGNVTEIE